MLAGPKHQPGKGKGKAFGMWGQALRPKRPPDTSLHSQLEKGNKNRSHDKFRKGPRVQPLRAEPKRPMLLVGRPLCSACSRAEAGPRPAASGRSVGPLEQHGEGQRMQRPLAQPTEPHLQQLARADAVPRRAGPPRGMAPQGPDAWSTAAAPSRGPGGETEASHVCKMHLVKINMGFCLFH